MAKNADIKFADCIVKKGQRCSVGYAIRENGDMEVESYLEGLQEREVIGLWRVLVELIGPQTVLPITRFRRLTDHIYEVKYFTGPRVFCFVYKGVWWLTHGYTKKKRKTPDKEKERAEVIRKEHIVRFWGGG
jgi:hypothetical protein